MITPEEEKEQESKIDEYLEILALAYILSLSRSALKTQLTSSVEAITELNNARGKVGLEPVTIDKKKLTASAIKSTEEYEKLFREKGGSFVVERVGNTEKLVFKPWLNDLKTDTKEKLMDVFKRAKTEEWTQSKIKSELNKLEELTINKRARAAAFTETRVQQYTAQMRTWAYGGLEEVQRHAYHDGATCGICIDLDRHVFTLGTEAPLSHVSCRCYYTPYITKDAKY